MGRTKTQSLKQQKEARKQDLVNFKDDSFDIEENQFGKDREEEQDENQQTYTVEAIRDRRGPENNREYLIKWLGWKEQFNTWEPVTNLTNVQEMLRAFDKLYVDKIKNNQKPLIVDLPSEQIKKKLKGNDEEAIDARPLTEIIEQNSVKGGKKKELAAQAKQREDIAITAVPSDQTDQQISKHDFFTEIEKIIDRRKRDGKVQYRVKYAGEKEPVWESEEKLTEAGEAIRQFEETLQGGKNSVPKKQSASNPKKSSAQKIVGDGSNIDASILPEYLRDYEEGSFAAGDIVDDIDGRHIHQGQSISSFLFRVTWKARADGVVPLPSHLSYNFVKKHAPYKVCEFWEQIYRSTYEQGFTLKNVEQQTENSEVQQKYISAQAAAAAAVEGIQYSTEQ